MLERIAFNFYATGKRLNGDRNLRRDVALKAFVHQIKRCANGDGGDSDTDEQPKLLAIWRCADEVAGFQILRSCAGNGGGDTDNSADHERQDGIVGSGPSGDEEYCAGSHEGGDAHAADRIGRVAEKTADASSDSDEKKSKDDDEDRGKKILVPASGGAFNGMESEKHPNHGDDYNGADDYIAHRDVLISSGIADRVGCALSANIF